jgi:hypothetical protein
VDTSPWAVALYYWILYHDFPVLTSEADCRVEWVGDFSDAPARDDIKIDEPGSDAMPVLFEPLDAFFCCHRASISDKEQSEHYRY